MYRYFFPSGVRIPQERLGVFDMQGRRNASNTEACGFAVRNEDTALLNSLKRNTRSGSDPDNFKL